jgi:hypothetical protein
MNVLKQALSTTAEQADQDKTWLEGFAREMNAWLRKAQELQARGELVGANTASGTAPGPAATVPAPQPATQVPPAPLSQANLEENERLQNKMHNRSASKSGQAPAAPTSAQPPFSLPPHQSPHGQPLYTGKPSVTQDTLQLPPTKKRKMGAPPNAPVAGQAAPVGPSAKQQSPEMKRATPLETKSVPKPQFVCPHPDCQTNGIGFATEEAHKAHLDEEHVKPRADPLGFVRESLTNALGLEGPGHPSAAATGAEHPLPASTAMSGSTSKQGQAAPNKAEPATPMSRTESMNRQVSAPGTRFAEAGKETPGKSIASADDAWHNSAIDPQELSSMFGSLGETAANGAVADFSLWRQVPTPNDTPESKEDSGASEPSSEPPTTDVLTDAAQFDLGGIDLFLTGPDNLLEELTKVNFDPSTDSHDVADLAQAITGYPDNSWEPEWTLGSADKGNNPLDMSLYSFTGF